MGTNPADQAAQLAAVSGSLATALNDDPDSIADLGGIADLLADTVLGHTCSVAALVDAFQARGLPKAEDAAGNALDALMGAVDALHALRDAARAGEAAEAALDVACADA